MRRPTTAHVRAAAALAAGLAVQFLLLTPRFEPDASGPPRLAAAAVAADTTAYYLGYTRWGLRVGGVVMAVAFVNLCAAHHARGGAGKPGRLPPFPLDQARTQIVVGEVHHQDGSPSPEPAWLTIPEAGLCTGVLCLGATGAGKTSTALMPALYQLLAAHANDPERKLAGLIIDPKGNMGPDVRALAAEFGREGDVVEIAWPTARYNVLRRPDLHPVALAGHLSEVLKNLDDGGGQSDFWANAARELAAQSLRLITLVERRPPTMADLYRVAASPDAFNQYLDRVRARRASMPSNETEELDSLEYWYNNYLRKLDDKTRTSILANLSQYASLFDVPEIRRCFCPKPEEETFLGFEQMLEEGRIVVLSLPQAVLKQVAQVVGTLTKLSFFDAVLARLAKAEGANATVGRTCFLLADEYDVYCTQPGDGAFLAKCREARCITILATQDIASLGRVVRNQYSLRQLLAQFRSLICLPLNDPDSAEDVAKLFGRIERAKANRSVSETNPRASFSFLDGRTVSTEAASAAVSTNYSLREEYLFPPRAITHLDTGTAIVRAFDGSAVRPAWVVYLRRVDEIRTLLPLRRPVR